METLRRLGTAMRTSPRSAPPFPRFDAERLPRPVRVELLTTEDPIIEYDRRRVLDRTTLVFERIGTWVPFKLVGEKREHQFSGQARHRGWSMEFELRITLHGHLWKQRRFEHRIDVATERIWLSRGYIHGDLRRACFAAPRPQEAFEGRVWFATLKPGDLTVAGETLREFTFGQTPEGSMRVDLHGDHSYELTWKVHRDGVGRDYHSAWFRRGELLSESVESVFGLPVRDSSCASLMTADYCDGPDI